MFFWADFDDAKPLLLLCIITIIALQRGIVFLSCCVCVSLSRDDASAVISRIAPLSETHHLPHLITCAKADTQRYGSSSVMSLSAIRQMTHLLPIFLCGFSSFNLYFSSSFLIECQHGLTTESLMMLPQVLQHPDVGATSCASTSVSPFGCLFVETWN